MSVPKSYTSVKDEMSQIAKLATPVAIWSLGLMLMGFVDVLCVARLEDSAQLAAVSLGHIYSFSVIVFGQGVLRGLDPFMSQAHGAGEKLALAEHLWRALLYALVLTVPICIFHWFASPLLTLVNQPESVVPITASYCNALIWGIFPSMIFVALGQFFQNLGKVMLPMLAILVANVVNLVVDMMLVLGFEPLSIPALGATGCGHATSAVRWVMCAVLMVFGWATLRKYKLTDFKKVFSWRENVRVLAKGLPIGAQSCFEGWAFSVLALMMGWLGAVELAAHAVVINLVAMTYMVPAGIGAAAATRVGHLIGLGSKMWSRSAWISVGFSVAWMSLMGVFLWVFRSPIANYYASEDAVYLAIVGLLPVAAAFQVFDGVQVTIFGALRGAGDTQFPALLNMIAYWAVGLPVGYLLGVYYGLGSVALWGSVAAALMMISVFVVFRLLWLERRGVERV